MAIEIGKVISIQGTAEVTHANGATEALQAGSPVYENDVITTGKNSTVDIDFNDGSNFKIGAEYTAYLNSDIYDPSAQVADAAENGVLVTPIGVVIALEGDVTVLRDGELIKLEEGDLLLPGDVIEASDNSKATLEMIDGSTEEIAPNQIATLGDDYVADTPQFAQATPAEVEEAMQEGAVDDQTDQSQGLPPAAAGPGDPAPQVEEDEGINQYVIVPEFNSAPVESGHDTTGPSNTFPTGDDELPTNDEDFQPALEVEGGTADERALNPDGSNSGSPDEMTSGNITFDVFGDGLGSVTINGEDVTGGGVVITPLGTLTVTDNGGGNYSWEYLLDTHADHPEGDQLTGTAEGVTDDFIVIVTDGDGSTAEDILSIAILDDGPTAIDDDGGTVTEDGSSFVSGNVVTNDESGADTPKAFVEWDAAGNAAAIAELETYGDLTLNAVTGAWEFTLDNALPATQALDAGDNLSFDLDYTMSDADGDESSATLTININGADDTATVETAQAQGPDNTVYEAGLEPDGSDAIADSEEDSGQFTIEATDGIEEVIIGGETFTFAELDAFDGSQSVDTGEGILTLDNYTGDGFSGTVDYTYELKATIDNDSKVDATDTEFDDSLTITVNGIGGSTGSDDLVVRIEDDTPTANDDGPASVTEDGTSFISGDVLTNDDSGADTPKAFVEWDAAGNAAAVAALETYGDLTLNNDGTWDYTLDNTLAATQALTDAFDEDYVLNYTMTDADGDQSTAGLTINVNGANDTATVETAQAQGPDNTVYEAGLEPDGSDAAANSEEDSGQFTIEATDGIEEVIIGGETFTFAELDAFDGSQSVDTGEGILTLDNYTGDGFSGTVDYTYELKATIDNDSKVDATDTEFDDSLTITVNGIGGSTGSDDLVVRIEDDTPTANDDGPASVTEDGTSFVSGDVLTNDDSGADTPKAFVEWDAAGNAAAVAALETYGDLTLNNDGTWDYTLDNTLAATQALTDAFDEDYVLNYTMTDADGDQSTAGLTINVNGADDGASVNTAVADGPDNTVYEAGLEPDGSDAAANSEEDSGQFTIEATDGIEEVIIGGTTFTFAELDAFDGSQSVDTGEGILTLDNYTGDGFSGTVDYTYELKATIDNDSKVDATDTEFDDSLTITVNGIGGSTGSDDLVVRIEDDTPTANDDGPASVTEDGTSFVSGDVLTNDDSGADTPKAFVEWDAAGNAAAVAALETYGDLTLNNDGTWDYTLDNTLAATQALTDAFDEDYVLNYTMTDADGDQSTAGLTINVNGANDTATVETAQAQGPDNTVYEAGLEPDGSDAAANSEEDSGQFTIEATDGIEEVIIGGTTFTFAELDAFDGSQSVDTGEGILTLDNYTGDGFSGTVDYTYELKATIDNDSKVDATDTEFDDSLTITVNGIGGSTGSDDLVVRIEDDTPTANDDGPASVTEDGTSFVSGDVLTNDDSGADTPKAFVEWDAAGNAAAVAALETYGDLTLNNDGTWDYTLDNTLAATQALTDAFDEDYVLNYTMTDADGDQSTAGLTINVNGANDTATVETAQAQGPDNTVYEAGLEPDGSDFIADSEEDSGQFTVEATDGIEEVIIGGTTFTFAELDAFDGSQSVDTGEGILTLDNYTGDGFSGTVDYTYELKATIDNDSKVDATDTEFDDSLTITVNGIGGTTASDELVVRIVDDTPSIAPINGVLKNESSDILPDVSITGTLNVGSGADGVASITLTLDGLVDGDPILANDATPLTSDGDAVLYRVVDGGFEGYVGATTIFTVSVNEIDGTYTVDLVGLLDGAAVPINFNLGADISGGNTSELFLVEPGVTYDGGTGEPSDPGGTVIWAQGSDTDPGDNPTMNSSAQGMGVGTANKIDSTETLRLNFTNASSWDLVGSDLILNDDIPDPGVVTYKSLDTVGVSFDHFGAGNVINWTLYASDGTTIIGAGTISGANGINASNDTAIDLYFGMAVGDYSFINDSGGTVTVTVTDAIDAQFSILDLTAGNVATDFRVSGLSTSDSQSGLDLPLDITSTVTDGDGDTATDVFTVTFDGENSLEGDTADNVISGGSGDDILVGLGGDDVMTGNGGSDTFVWTAGERGNGDTDVINDFADGLGGDILNLAGLLDGESANSASLVDYLDFEESVSGLDTIINITSDGGATVDQTIILKDIDLTADSGLSNAQIIDALLVNNLIVDA